MRWGGVSEWTLPRLGARWPPAHVRGRVPRFGRTPTPCCRGEPFVHWRRTPSSIGSGGRGKPAGACRAHANALIVVVLRARTRVSCSVLRFGGPAHISAHLQMRGVAHRIASSTLGDLGSGSGLTALCREHRWMRVPCKRRQAGIRSSCVAMEPEAERHARVILNRAELR